MEWGHRQVLHTAPHLTLVDKATGDPLHIGYVNTQGHEVKPHQVQIVPTPKG